MINWLMKYNGTINIVYDGMYGSCGKGKILGTTARSGNFGASVNNNSANAGHTFVFNNGYKAVTSHLPVAVVSNTPVLCIGTDAQIDAEKLYAEIAEYQNLLGTRKIYVHENAGIILPKHKEQEKQTLRSGSTFRGAGAAKTDKIMRTAVLAKDILQHDKIVLLNARQFNDLLFGKDNDILLETGQGFGLSLNSSGEYPNVTSYDCTPQQALASINAPIGAKVKTICVIRPYPIRISNKTEIGEINSGKVGNANEISWEEIEHRAKLSRLKDKEQSTVTKQTRRVFEFERNKFEDMLAITRPDEIVVNFIQYVNGSLSGMDTNSVIKNYRKFNEEGYAINSAMEYVAELREKFGVNISALGTGAKENDLIEMNKLPNKILHCFEMNCAYHGNASPLDYCITGKTS